MKVLIFGVTGMLGNAMFRALGADEQLDVCGTARSGTAHRYFSKKLSAQIVTGVDVENQDSLIKVFAAVRPDVVINCIGLVKQLADANDPLQAVPINTLFPHRMAALCLATRARLIHISTDCVFSGNKGNYLEDDFPDAHDLYGRSKLLGEVTYPYSITLRTSIIGHELAEQKSLVEWFLSQQGSVKGFSRAIFSGLPTIELARIVRDFVLPRPELSGLYHVAAKPIDKFNLLTLIAAAYGKTIDIAPDEKLVIDRSLNADRFKSATGYVAPEWPNLIAAMHEFQ